MEVEVAEAANLQAKNLVLSIRCGESRRQAPLQGDTRIIFPQDAVAGGNARQMQVDIFQKVGSQNFSVDSRQEVYTLSGNGELQPVSLRVRPPGTTVGTPRRRIDAAMASEEYIDQHDLRHFVNQALQQPQQQQQQRPPLFGMGARSEISGSDISSTTEERLARVKAEASEYVDRFDLRDVLQKMFQKVIKDRPENPFEFMQNFLSADGSVPSRHNVVASVEADAELEEGRMRREQETKQQMAVVKAENDTLSARVAALQQRLQDAEVSFGGDAEMKSYFEQQLANRRKETEDLQQRVVQLDGRARDAEARYEDAANNNASLEQQLRMAQQQVQDNAMKTVTAEVAVKRFKQLLSQATDEVDLHRERSDALQRQVQETDSKRLSAVEISKEAERKLAEQASTVELHRQRNHAMVQQVAETESKRAEAEEKGEEFKRLLEEALAAVQVHSQQVQDMDIQLREAEARALGQATQEAEDKYFLAEIEMQEKIAEKAMEIESQHHQMREMRQRIQELESSGTVIPDIVELAEVEASSKAALQHKDQELLRAREEVEKKAVEFEVQHQQIQNLEKRTQDAEVRASGVEAFYREQHNELDKRKQQLEAADARIQSLEQDLQEARKMSAPACSSPTAESDAASAYMHEAAAARDAAVSRELAAAATAVQVAAEAKEAAVQRELVALEKITELERWGRDIGHQKAKLERTIQEMEADASERAMLEGVGSMEAARALKESVEKEVAAAREIRALTSQLETERGQRANLEREHKEVVQEHAILEQKHEETLEKGAAPPQPSYRQGVQLKQIEKSQAALKSVGPPRPSNDARAATGAGANDDMTNLKAKALEVLSRPGTGYGSDVLISNVTQKKQLVSKDDDEAVTRQALVERAEIERHCHEEALMECAQLQETNDELQKCLADHEATVGSLQQRLQQLEGSSAATYQEQLDSQQTKIEVLQRKIAAYEACTAGVDDAAAGGGAARTNASAGWSKEAVNTVASPLLLRPPGSMNTVLPPGVQGTINLPRADVNAHMFSHFLASTPPLPLTTYIEAREDEDIELPEPNPSVLVEVLDCKDVMTNGIFAWVGMCNLRPLYRLLGPEPRYLYYAENDIASNWRIVNKMGAEDFVERFRRPSDAKLPVDCEKGDYGGCAVEARLTPEVLSKISMINSHEEKLTIRAKFAEVYGEQFNTIEGKSRGLISKASPVVAVAHALESQQRAVQLLHSQLSAEVQRREAAEQHSQTMEEAFETLQLRIQAQLPGPPNVANLQEIHAINKQQRLKVAEEEQQQRLKAAGPPRVADRDSNIGTPLFSDGGGASRVFEDNLKATVFDPTSGKPEWAPDLGPGCGPVPCAPMAPKDRKPQAAPTFRRGPASMRSTPLPGRSQMDTPSVPQTPGGPGGPSPLSAGPAESLPLSAGPAESLATPEREAAAIFSHLDQNNDGVLSKEELAAGVSAGVVVRGPQRSEDAPRKPPSLGALS